MTNTRREAALIKTQNEGKTKAYYNSQFYDDTSKLIEELVSFTLPIVEALKSKLPPHLSYKKECLAIIRTFHDCYTQSFLAADEINKAYQNIKRLINDIYLLTVSPSLTSIKKAHGPILEITYAIANIYKLEMIKHIEDPADLTYLYFKDSLLNDAIHYYANNNEDLFSSHLLIRIYLDIKKDEVADVEAYLKSLAEINNAMMATQTYQKISGIKIIL